MENNWTAEWFEENFFDIRQHRPKKGQCLAQYRAVAYFVDGWVKRNVINVLKENTCGAESVHKVMKKMVGAEDMDAILVPFEMTRDLIAGMSDEEVAKKEYRMLICYNYWTKKENVPTDDLHWSVINILNTEDIDSRVKFTYTMPEE